MQRIVCFRTIVLVSFAFVLAAAAQSQTFTTLASFDGTNGSYYPSSNLNSLLVQGTDGNLYGTTPAGGAATTCLPAGSGCGTVFRITPAGTLTVIYSFCTTGYPACADGYAPTGLILGNNGSLYGVSQGGVGGTGTVFQITTAGVLTTYNLCETNCFYSTIGAGPGTITETTGGVFYGTAVGGGQNAMGGTIFKMTPAGAFSLFYHFCSLANCADGAMPEGPVSVARNGDVYATAVGENSENVYGTAVQITPAGVLAVLHTFCSETNCVDGANPFAGLVEGTNGKYYGATYRDGIYGGGTIFDLSTAGALTTLHSVGAKVAGGFEPYGTLYLATDGNFYGTTVTEGANQEGGTIFSMTPAGKFTTLYSFCAHSGCADGAGSYAGLIQATDGNFYGTTSQGGTSDLGAVYKLSMGLAPFVKAVPDAGAPGAQIRILGNDLTGATAVMFNGTAAAFTVKSASLIVASVPAGATTGKVDVVTPGGTLVSNAAFVVR